MSIQKIQLDLLRLKTEVVAGAYVQLSGQAQVGKTAMTQWLAERINSGLISIDQIKGMAPAPVSTAKGADQVQIDALNAEVTKLGMSIQRNYNDAEHRINHVQQLTQSIHNKLQTLEGDIVKLDSKAISQTVGDMIANAFEPFKQAVQSAGAESIVADMSSVRVVDRKSCMDLFGVDLPFDFDVYNHPCAPSIDPNFIWTEDILRSLAFAQATGSNLWFGGAKGTGKSETARQFSARTGRGFTRINFHKYSTASEYIGDVGLENGQTVFKQGDFLQAYTCPSSVVLLDEVTNCSEGELAPLNAFLEPNPQVNYGGHVWRKASGVMVIGADNTLLSGDSSGLYGGTKAMNVAFGERFNLVIEFKHMLKHVEVDAVVRHTGCRPALADHVIDAFRVCRAKVDTGDVIDSPSIRQVIAFIKALPFMTVEQAWERTVCARQPLESATALKAIGQASLNEETIKGLL